jgi:hypothetical protein
MDLSDWQHSESPVKRALFSGMQNGCVGRFKGPESNDIFLFPTNNSPACILHGQMQRGLPLFPWQEGDFYITELFWQSEPVLNLDLLKKALIRDIDDRNLDTYASVLEYLDPVTKLEISSPSPDLTSCKLRRVDFAFFPKVRPESDFSKLVDLADLPEGESFNESVTKFFMANPKFILDLCATNTYWARNMITRDLYMVKPFTIAKCKIIEDERKMKDICNKMHRSSPDIVEVPEAQTFNIEREDGSQALFALCEPAKDISAICYLSEEALVPVAALKKFKGETQPYLGIFRIEI